MCLREYCCLRDVPLLNPPLPLRFKVYGFDFVFGGGDVAPRLQRGFRATAPWSSTPTRPHRTWCQTGTADRHLRACTTLSPPKVRSPMFALKPKVAGVSRIFRRPST